ncbi:hypothetical protein Tco_0453121 [Tanacetum coccineum]
MTPEEEPEEDDEDPEEDPADYPADGEDDDERNEDEDEGEERHPAPADLSTCTLEEVERLLALTTPPPSPLTPLLSPLPHIPSPPLPIPSPPPNSPTHIEVPESCLPLWKRVHFASPTPSHEVGESSAADAARQDRPTIARDDPYSIAREELYGFFNMVDDDLVGAIDEITPTTLEGVNLRVTDLATIVEEETTIMYGIMEDAQDDRSMIEREAKMAREAWGLSMDASDYERSDVMSLHTTVMAQSALISELQSEITRRHRCEVLEQSNDPRKVGNSTMHQQRLVAFLDFGYVVAMLCKPVKYYGLFPASKLYMNLFVFVSYQYRSFVQYYLLSTAY